MGRREDNHCRIVSDSLKGKRAVDTHTFESLEVLKDRLERLKSSDSSFEQVRFSPHINKLKNSHRIMAAV
jgi:hypothetical protein